MVKYSKRSRQKASSVMEYMALIVFIISALFVFQHYILRGMSGGWKRAGDVFGYGRQYDPRDFGNSGELGGTLECYFDNSHCAPGGNPVPPCVLLNAWVSEECVKNRPCQCYLLPEDPNYQVACLQCLRDCSELVSAQVAKYCR